MQARTSILWRRLDSPGHDACRLETRARGWSIEGAAAFRLDGTPAGLTYHLACDPEWRTEHARVRGWIGARAVEFSIERIGGDEWRLDDVGVPGLESCVDLDLGFTPATNLSQLRRIGLAEGRAADVPVAWFDVSTGRLTELRQRYERRSATDYWYVADAFDYRAVLEVDPAGFVLRYPGLWEAEGIMQGIRDEARR